MTDILIKLLENLSLNEQVHIKYYNNFQHKTLKYQFYGSFYLYIIYFVLFIFIKYRNLNSS